MSYNVYLISANIDDIKLYKIGFTKRNVEDRVREFKTGNCLDLQIEYVINSKWGTKIEKRLHKMFVDKKISGEWFNLSDEDVINLINTSQTLHESFNIIENENTFVLETGGLFKK